MKLQSVGKTYREHAYSLDELGFTVPSVRRIEPVVNEDGWMRADKRLVISADKSPPPKKLQRVKVHAQNRRLQK